jgi:menaquinone-dependent protoporphyrinogen oxidase
MTSCLIVYGSRLGSTAAIAEHIAASLRENGIAARAEPADSAPDPAAYDAVLIGSAVYAGHWLDEPLDYVRRYDKALTKRPVWLFSSGPVGDLAIGHEPVEPREVGDIKRRVGTREHRTFFGALDRTRIDGSDLGRLERIIARRFVPEGDYRDWARIDAWADGIVDELIAEPIAFG